MGQTSSLCTYRAKQRQGRPNSNVHSHNTSNIFIPPSARSHNKNHSFNDEEDLLEIEHDLEVLFHYLDNNCPVSRQQNSSQSWAEQPRTLGSLSLVFICYLFEHRDHLDLTEIVQEEQYLFINDFKVDCDVLYGHLKLNFQENIDDRVQNSVLLLLELAQYPESIPYLCKKGVFDWAILLTYSNNHFPQEYTISCLLLFRFFVQVSDQNKLKSMKNEKFRNNIKKYLQDNDLNIKIAAVNTISDLVHDKKLKNTFNQEIIYLLDKEGFTQILQTMIDSFIEPRELSPLEESLKEKLVTDISVILSKIE